MIISLLVDLNRILIVVRARIVSGLDYARLNEFWSYKIPEQKQNPQNKSQKKNKNIHYPGIFISIRRKTIIKQTKSQKFVVQIRLTCIYT